MRKSTRSVSKGGDAKSTKSNARKSQQLSKKGSSVNEKSVKDKSEVGSNKPGSRYGDEEVEAESVIQKVVEQEEALPQEETSKEEPPKEEEKPEVQAEEQVEEKEAVEEVNNNDEEIVQQSQEDDNIDDIKEHVTVETKGQGIADMMQEVNQSYNATEKVAVAEEEKFYDPADQQETYTEAGRDKDYDPSLHGDYFDDEEIQPKKKGLFTDQTINLVQDTWAQLASLGDERVGIVLFKNIFKIAPQALELFAFKDEPDLYSSQALKIHGATVVNTVGTAVRALSEVEAIVPILQELGYKHAKKGVLAEHYPIVGQALQNTLRAGLKKAYSPAVKDAWNQVYTVVTQTMISDYYTNPDVLSDELTDQKIKLVQDSWQEVLSLGQEQVGAVVFENLFKLKPQLVDMFRFGSIPNYQESHEFINHAKTIVATLTKAIENLQSMDALLKILKNIGYEHLDRGVMKEDYDVLGQAVLISLEYALGQNFNFELKHAWKVTYDALKKGLISDNYEEQDHIKKLTQGKYAMTQEEIDIVVKGWRKANTQVGQANLAVALFKNILKIAPEMNDLFGFDTDPAKMDKLLLAHGVKVCKEMTNCIASLEDISILQGICHHIREIHGNVPLKSHHHVVLREALLLTLEENEGEDFPNEIKWAWVKAYNIIRNLMSNSDPTDNQDSIRGIDIWKKRLVQYSWSKLKRYPGDVTGPLVYKHLFNLNPQAIEYFPFKDQKNFLQSAIVKKQAAAVIGIVGRGIEGLDDFEKVVTILNALGNEHRTRSIKREHYNWIEVGLYAAIEEADGPHFDATVKRAWEEAYYLLTEKMLMTESFDHNVCLLWLNLDQNNNDEPTIRESGRDETTRPLVDGDSNSKPGSSEGMALEGGPNRSPTKIEKPKDEQAAIDEQRAHYVSHFRKEVDFHHKVAYRFEKAYRLGKKMTARRQTLNLEIIDCISEHSGYIETDSMALFYCLFFCVYFRNEELLDFIRSLIERVPSIPKIDKLLEFIDVNGIDKIRTVGEQINGLVYHMVFYQAVDDDLRIVYSSIFRQCRFIQLRDKDALHFLNQRDYELIRQSFDKHTTKMNIEQFGYTLKDTSLKCQSYRKYNPAYYEEIVINNQVEARVAQNYREKFLVTAEDIYIVFDMYCKEDYDDQFLRTKKNEITHKQFVDLFITCLKNDSFRIAMLIYTLYLDINRDMDERMMDIVMNTIRDSVKFHEFKLFFIHEHFDTLSIQQMNYLVDIYQEILHRKDVKIHPIISQFNTVKVALLIYRICWKIEKKQIYSLITKCTLLQTYLIKSLEVYFEKQSNILTLYKFMLEPILHMSERKDSLDIMYEMNMQQLLKHPIVVEVLNLVNEGKYSISSSPLSMSQTFQCMLDMQIMSLKSINDRLIQNIVNFGDSGSTKQTSLQYNIWKQSIDQRQQDEMFFTTLFSGVMALFAIIINQNLNNAFAIELRLFGDSIVYSPDLLLSASNSQLSEYCPSQLKASQAIYNSASIFNILALIYLCGMATSVIQKITIFRVKDNVQFDFGQIFIEISGAAISFLYLVSFSDKPTTKLMSDNCNKVLQLTEEEIFQIDKVFNMVSGLPGELNFKFVVSCLVIQLSIISIIMLQRTQYLGELIIMLNQMIGELVRFFTTFGLVLALFLFVGRFLSEQFYFSTASYWEVFLDMFNAFNGKPNFFLFSVPIGQIYVGSFLFLFKILLVSLLAAMFINKYKVVWKNLDAYKRFTIIRLKNSIAYDRFLGGITITFFPINIFILPFMIPVVAFRSKRISDFLLKLQYVFMMSMYSAIAGCLIIPATPFLYIKASANSIFIFATNKRESYKGENIVQLLMTMLVCPLIIPVSILIDFLSLPSILLKESKGFEHKYQQSDNRLNDAQIEVVMSTFGKIFYGLNFVRFKDKHMTLIELMQMHRGIFSLIQNLHDLTCRGNKDYKEALGKVQDYNMTKILTRQCSIPDLNGDYKESKVELNVIYAVQFDIEIYNYIDVVLRKLRMGTLAAGVNAKENDIELSDEVKADQKDDQDGGDDDDDETKKVEGVLLIGIGPDGVPLKRNNSDVMNNFWINYVVRAFTECEQILAGINQNEKRREKRFAEQIQAKQEQWFQNTIDKFTNATNKYEHIIRTNFVKHDGSTLDNKIIKKSNSKENTESTGGSSGQNDKSKLANKDSVKGSVHSNKRKAASQAHRSKTSKQ